MTEKWDDIFSFAKGTPVAEAPPTEPAPQPKADPKPKAKASSPPPKAIAKTSPKPAATESPWGDLEPEDREATVRLNVDIPVSLNDALAAKARRLRKPKTELVRRLLEWALDDSTE